MSKTATKERVVEGDVEVAQSKGEVAVLAPPRLPYHPAIEERFGVDKAGWKALTEAVWPTAKTTDSIVMALSYCRARKLDPFKRVVHIVPMWDSKKGGYVDTIWPGIAELRTTAFRTSQYAGCDETVFGPITEQTFKGRKKVNNEWKEESFKLRFPEWAQVTVYRDLNGRICKFVGPKVFWMETYATVGNSDLPNEMWRERTVGQLDKCAEAGALRKAFPEELGNMLTAEEMEGRHIIDGDTPPKDVSPNATPASLAGKLDALAAPPTQPASNEPAAPSRAMDTAAPAAVPSQAQAAGAVLLSKDDLVASFGAVESKLGAMQWMRQHEAAIEALSDEDRRAFEKKFTEIEAKLPA